jgi:hypothetical protein
MKIYCRQRIYTTCICVTLYKRYVFLDLIERKKKNKINTNQEQNVLMWYIFIS